MLDRRRRNPLTIINDCPIRQCHPGANRNDLEAIMRTATANGANTISDFPSNRQGEILANDWGMLAIRGLLAVIFGIIALFKPGVTILSLLLLFAAYMLVDSCFAFYNAFTSMRRSGSWGLPLIQGIIILAAGLISFLWPGITIVAFALVLAAWSIVSGCLMLAGATAVSVSYGRGWLIFGGLVSLLFGVMMIVAPLIGMVVLTWWLGAYALVVGATVIVLAFQLRSRHEASKRVEQVTRPAS